LLGHSYLRDISKNTAVTTGATAEKAFRRSIKLDPSLARAHRALATALLLQAPPDRGLADPRRVEADKELTEARRLDPTLNLAETQAMVAVLQDRLGDAESLYLQALKETPDDVDLARGAALCMIQNKGRKGPYAAAVKSLCDKFPDDGMLVCLQAVAWALDNDPRSAVRELERARRLGTDPATVLPPALIQNIEAAATPGWLERFVWIMVYFAGSYAAVMLLMAGVGLVLANRTRGTKALQLIEGEADELVSAGQVLRTQQESTLAKLYGLALFAGLILFYVAIPFILAGLVALTLLLLYFTFMLPRIPVKLLVIIVVVGLGGVWAVLKSVFTRPASGSFGMQKGPTDCPRLFDTLNEVARRVDTGPVHEVYLAPGASIGVHQEGRGPFGIFGVKRRVLTLGVSTMHFLTVQELKSILAHEYAHFSHKDTFYSRFIYQVHLSIENALNGMGQAGGKLNYVNPFYWFLYLYYRSYSLLAAGYSRSREFLADRMSSTLYGSDVFASALTKVSTDGRLFESVLWDNIGKLLQEGKAFINMYEAFRDFRNDQLSNSERDEIYKKMLDEKASVFASHPTIGERLEAVASLPAASEKDATLAVQLFEDQEAVEKELTEFMTGYMSYIHQLQAQAAQG
jgi:Zn-dependent protease with chaperone function